MPAEHRSLWKNAFIRKLYTGVGLIILSITFGVSGFSIIEGMGWLDAFYMTIITVSTVGFSEVQPLSNAGKIFTSFLIITNISTFFYSLTVISTALIDGEFRQYIRNRNLMKQLQSLNNHVIVIGFGRNGKQVCHELMLQKREFVVIDKALSEHEQSTYPYLFVIDDATDDAVLEQVGIRRANALISALSKDADNVFVILTARELNPKILLISRASSETTESKLKRAGANYIIMPERIGGSHMAQLILNQDIHIFLNALANNDGGSSIMFIEYGFSPHFLQKTWAHVLELNYQHKTGAVLVGVKMPKGKFVINPDPDFTLLIGYQIIIIGNSAQINALKHLISS